MTALELRHILDHRPDLLAAGATLIAQAIGRHEPWHADSVVKAVWAAILTPLIHEANES